MRVVWKIGFIRFWKFLYVMWIIYATWTLFLVENLFVHYVVYNSILTGYKKSLDFRYLVRKPSTELADQIFLINSSTSFQYPFRLELLKPMVWSYNNCRIVIAYFLKIVVFFFAFLFAWSLKFVWLYKKLCKIYLSLSIIK